MHRKKSAAPKRSTGGSHQKSGNSSNVIGCSRLVPLRRGLLLEHLPIAFLLTLLLDVCGSVLEGQHTFSVARRAYAFEHVWPAGWSRKALLAPPRARGRVLRGSWRKRIPALLPTADTEPFASPASGRRITKNACRCTDRRLTAVHLHPAREVAIKHSRTSRNGRNHAR